MPKHNFAQQVLKQLNIKINCGDYNIPDEDVEIQNDYLSEFNTSLLLNKHLSTVKNASIQIDYEDLQRLGFQITKKSATGKYFKFQKMEYFIVKLSSFSADIGGIPKKHIVEYNYQENWVRLVGDNSSGKRVFVHRADYTKPQKEITINDLTS